MIRATRIIMILVAVAGGTYVVQGQQQAALLAAPKEDRVGFPEGYQGWRVLFVLDRPDNKQVRVIYGNAKAEQAVAGKMFQNGSVLVMETYRAKLNDKNLPLLDANGRYQRGDLTGVFVQRRELGFGVDYGENRNGNARGGWEYAAYKPDKTLLRKPEETGACAACHLTQSGPNRDYVFRANLFFTKASGAVPTAIIKNYSFVPNAIAIKAGQSVTWYNDDEAVHTVTSPSNGLDSGDLVEGSSFTQKFEKAGTFEIQCLHHAAMKTTVIVEPGN
jgi:plastocyanin